MPPTARLLRHDRARRDRTGAPWSRRGCARGLDGDRPRPLLSARSGGCGALPRVRASADGRWASVPAGARVRARATRSHGRGEQAVRGNRSLPLQLLQLRLPPAPSLRPGRRALRPPRRRSDRDVSRLRRRDGRSNRGDQPGARRCDDRAVAVQPRRASRARDRARRPALDLECSRPVDLPSAGRARAARRTACTSHRDELVRQPEQGRRGHRLARPAPRPRSLRADLRGSHATRRSSTFVSSDRSRRNRLPPSCGEATSIWRRAGTTPARTRCVEALASGLPAVFRASGGHPELVGDAGVAFDEPEEVVAALDRLVSELDERRAAIRVTPLADVADRYLEVLRG